MAAQITENTLTDWLSFTGLDHEDTSLPLSKSPGILDTPEYREFALKLMQKLIAKARYDLSVANLPTGPTSFPFQINCEIDITHDEMKMGIVLGCCGSGGDDSSCMPCVRFEVPITADD